LLVFCQNFGEYYTRVIRAPPLSDKTNLLAAFFVIGVMHVTDT
jgi:hypothetical protein